LKIDFIPFLSNYAHSSIATYTFGDTCSLGSNGSTNNFGINVVLDSFLEGRPSTGSRMLLLGRYTSLHTKHSVYSERMVSAAGCTNFLFLFWHK
jgi:hypothetical protein